MRTIILLIFFTIASKAQNNSVVIKLEENCSLELKREVFNPKEHKIDYDGKYVIGIDGAPLFGSDGEIPKYKLSKAILKIGDKTYNLQIDNMYNPWLGDDVNKRFFRIIHGSPNDHILKGQFSDGAGSYAAEWLIEWNSSIRDILTKDEIIIGSYFEK
ncbi:hypothetical protein [Flavobacterium sp.]|uniref:hypothetical protein n=1 Tax=Flavobacterium sp. TaxID=239 RepID=UPI0039E4F59C